MTNQGSATEIDIQKNLIMNRTCDTCNQGDRCLREKVTITCKNWVWHNITRVQHRIQYGSADGYKYN
jgi:hypothetical protein